MKRIVGMLIFCAPLFVISALAIADGKKKHQFQLPRTITKLAENVYNLGKKKDKDGTLVEGIAILHPRRPQGKGNNKGKNGGGNDTNCFAFIAPSGSGGVRWTNTFAEPYVLDPSNNDPTLDEVTVIATIDNALRTWDDQVSYQIFGQLTQGTPDRASMGVSVNGVNEWVFGDIAETNVIAVTIIWGIFSGPPQNRKLVEWDMIFDDVDFTWGNAGPTNETSLGDTSVMDLLNIAVHEAGHAAGMGHPSDTCTEETMFRFSTQGETKSRTLHTGDITGIEKLYDEYVNVKSTHIEHGVERSRDE